MQEIKRLVVRMANENSSWSYTRIHDLGHRVGRTTVSRILKNEASSPHLIALEPALQLH